MENLRIVVNPKVLLGKPVIKGTRITVEILLKKLAQNLSPQDILKDYPQLTEEDIKAAVNYAAFNLNEENRILLTNDLDFGRMVVHQKKPSAGIILMRFGNEFSEEKIKGVDHLLKFHSEKLSDHFTVISEDQIKIRPLT